MKCMILIFLFNNFDQLAIFLRLSLLYLFVSFLGQRKKVPDDEGDAMDEDEVSSLQILVKIFLTFLYFACVIYNNILPLPQKMFSNVKNS
jgi:hypothetical protein